MTILISLTLILIWNNKPERETIYFWGNNIWGKQMP